MVIEFFAMLAVLVFVVAGAGAFVWKVYVEAMARSSELATEQRQHIDSLYDRIQARDFAELVQARQMAAPPQRVVLPPAENHEPDEYAKKWAQYNPSFGEATPQ